MIEIPTKNVEAFILDLAAKHGVRYVKGPLDDLADTITRLSDDEVEIDGTEQLIIALKRARVITGSEMVAMLGAYLDQKKGAITP